uniref:Uncharacterized protein n=1 Tax=Picea glauca TaxID=3330 RepID=A0A101M4D4_PICGL|nr:hypothetical protein ABT39_MTgene523 [Picea glauca]
MFKTSDELIRKPQRYTFYIYGTGMGEGLHNCWWLLIPFCPSSMGSKISFCLYTMLSY